MKIATLPDGAMIIINQISKKGHTYISPTNFSKRTETPEEIIDKNKPPYNLTGEKLKNNSKYLNQELPSGVRGRLILLNKVLKDADACILIGKRPKDYKPLYGVLNELILFGGSGCENEHKLAVKMLKETPIPKLILKHPTNQEESIKLINTVNSFLDKVEEYKNKNIIINNDNLNLELKEDTKEEYSLDELKTLIKEKF